MKRYMEEDIFRSAVEMHSPRTLETIKGLISDEWGVQAEVVDKNKGVAMDEAQDINNQLKYKMSRGTLMQTD